MTLRTWITCALMLVGALTAPYRAHALGEQTFGHVRVNELNYKDWPKLVPLLDHETRYYHSWVNGHEFFAGVGDPSQLAKVIELYANAGLARPRIVLRPGPGETQTFEGQPLPCDWRIELCGGIASRLTTSDRGEHVWPAEPELTIFIGDRITLEGIRIPETVPVVGPADRKREIRGAIAASTDTSVRGWGTAVLADLDPFDPDGARAVADRLHDDAPWVRLNAAGTLARFGHLARVHAAALRKAGETDDESVKKRVPEALAAINAAQPREAEAKIHAERQAAIEQWLAARRKNVTDPRQP